VTAKRVIDFDAMWGSDKLAACAAWAQAEYAWLYGLADASGCFEVTNLRVIWGRVAAIRGNLTIERLEQIFAEFQDKGLLFVWEHEGKRYAHWTGSDVPGRLPPPSWRMRLEKFAPPVPKQRLAEYMAKFSRGRAALAYQRQGDLKFENSDLRDGREAGERTGNSGFAGRSTAVGNGARDGMPLESRDIAEGSESKECLEGSQGQDLDLSLNWKLGGDCSGGRDGRGAGSGGSQDFSREASREKNLNKSDSFVSNSQAHSYRQANSNAQANSNVNAMSGKELAVWRELRVGEGPVCGPARVKPEVLERIRRREAARAGGKSP